MSTLSSIQGWTNCPNEVFAMIVNYLPTEERYIDLYNLANISSNWGAVIGDPHNDEDFFKPAAKDFSPFLRPTLTEQKEENSWQLACIRYFNTMINRLYTLKYEETIIRNETKVAKNDMEIEEEVITQKIFFNTLPSESVTLATQFACPSVDAKGVPLEDLYPKRDTSCVLSHYNDAAFYVKLDSRKEYIHVDMNKKRAKLLKYDNVNEEEKWLGDLIISEYSENGKDGLKAVSRTTDDNEMTERSWKFPDVSLSVYHDPEVLVEQDFAVCLCLSGDFMILTASGSINGKSINWVHPLGASSLKDNWSLVNVNEEYTVIRRSSDKGWYPLNSTEDKAEYVMMAFNSTNGDIVKEIERSTNVEDFMWMGSQLFDQCIKLDTRRLFDCPKSYFVLENTDGVNEILANIECIATDDESYVLQGIKSCHAAIQLTHPNARLKDYNSDLKFDTRSESLVLNVFTNGEFVLVNHVDRTVTTYSLRRKGSSPDAKRTNPAEDGGNPESKNKVITSGVPDLFDGAISETSDDDFVFIDTDGRIYVFESGYFEKLIDGMNEKGDLECQL
ncbi:hypothetical protein NADFUDRAFT_63325 [Nadsonia fulvescens var. elongata DSM 6958]|uniref:F-box domain-containing protein n=1 Tax=Nadsonia fulvescens var. elongata DSM 6958 TaxID=857566 RepID=A0A1E3PRC0_9ASCO|nr:hypothetical protein NADFUDRAFT_63325 [Nadsonia fulvescens var. elongata DSM 6958]